MEIINILLVTAAFCGLVIAFVSTYLSNKKTQESNDLLRQDMKSRLRPILGRKSYSGTDNPSHLNDDQILIRFANYGMLSAINMSYEYALEIKENKKIKERIPNTGYTKKTGSSLAPNESFSIGMDYLPAHKIMAEQTDNLYFEWRMMYEDLNGYKYHYNLSGHFEKGIINYDVVDID